MKKIIIAMSLLLFSTPAMANRDYRDERTLEALAIIGGIIDSHIDRDYGYREHRRYRNDYEFHNRVRGNYCVRYYEHYRGRQIPRIRCN